LEQAQDLLPGRRRKILLIDDIADSGRTLQEPSYFGFLTATLVKRYTSTFTPDYIGCTIYNDNWIVFPWETANSQPIQDYLNIKQ
jgi:hypoxanthine phosphoribosyltransferase